jgi:hypothetical protein
MATVLRLLGRLERMAIGGRQQRAAHRSLAAAPSLSPAVAVRAATVRRFSDRADYKHTEREISKGRRATERAAYATLQISHDASEAEIKAQFRKLAMLYHPDVRPSLTKPHSGTALLCPTLALEQQRSHRVASLGRSPPMPRAAAPQPPQRTR